MPSAIFTANAPTASGETFGSACAGPANPTRRSTPATASRSELSATADVARSGNVTLSAFGDSGANDVAPARCSAGALHCIRSTAGELWTGAAGIVAILGDGGSG